MLQNQKIKELKDVVQSIDTTNLLISCSAVRHSYERESLDENDIYNLMRDVIEVTACIEIAKAEAAEI